MDFVWSGEPASPSGPLALRAPRPRSAVISSRRSFMAVDVDVCDVDMSLSQTALPREGASGPLPERRLR